MQILKWCWLGSFIVIVLQTQALRSCVLYVCYYGLGEYSRKQEKCHTHGVYNKLYFVIAVIPYWLRFLQVCICKFSYLFSYCRFFIFVVVSNFLIVCLLIVVFHYYYYFFYIIAFRLKILSLVYLTSRFLSFLLFVYWYLSMKRHSPPFSLECRFQICFVLLKFSLFTVVSSLRCRL